MLKRLLRVCVRVLWIAHAHMAGAWGRACATGRTRARGVGWWDSVGRVCALQRENMYTVLASMKQEGNGLPVCTHGCVSIF